MTAPISLERREALHACGFKHFSMVRSDLKSPVSLQNVASAINDDGEELGQFKDSVPLSDLGHKFLP